MKIAQGQDASVRLTLQASATLGKTSPIIIFFQRRGSNNPQSLPAPLKKTITPCHASSLVFPLIPASATSATSCEIPLSPFYLFVSNPI